MRDEIRHKAASKAAAHRERSQQPQRVLSNPLL
jgi:hypothetical protein